MKFLSIEESNSQALTQLIDLAIEMKATRGAHPELPLTGQTWAIIFTKASTRTRVSFEVGIRELGGSVMFLSKNDIQLGRGEPIKDTARVLGRMVHGAVIRTFDQQDVVDFSSYSGIPTINALTDEEHPCQILADLLTVRVKNSAPGKVRKSSLSEMAITTCHARGCGPPNTSASNSSSQRQNPASPLKISWTVLAQTTSH